MKKLFGLAAIVATTGLLTTPQNAQGADARPAKSSASDRKDVSITVYNQNFGLVREVRELNLGTGRVALEFADVASRLQPQTVHIKSLAGKKSLQVLEQNYRYDLLSASKLLEKYVGKNIRIYRFNKKLGREESYGAKLLSVAGGSPVLEINGEITYGFGGRFAFPKLPANLIPKPTLVWMLDSKKAKQKVEVTYLSHGLNWKADYVFVINDKDTAGDLTGWVTLDNRSGATYEKAKLKLVAGDVQRVRDHSRHRGYASARISKPGGSRPSFRQESFFEYHLYTLGRPTTVRQNEKKQVTLLTAQGAKVKKKLLFYGQQYWYRGRYGQVQSKQKVGVYLDLINSKKNNLGMPLPKGVVRVYKADKSGAKQFIGEDRIDHTPRDEKVRIKMGEAFDVVGNRKQTDYNRLGRCNSESEWEIELRNHKDTAAQVEIFEPIGGDWKIIRHSHPYKKRDARTFTFDVRIPARGKVKITYLVRVKWC